MASLRFFIPVLLAYLLLVIATPSLVTYEPECAQDCVLKSINGTCTGPEDSQCLCDNMRAVGSGSVVCAAAACNSSAEELALELRSGFTKYCSDANISVASSATAVPSFAWGGSGGGWGASATTITTTTSSTQTSSTQTSSTQTSSTGVLATGEAESPANVSASSSGGGLSAGAIAGIVVGGVIGVVSITGGLLLFAFRLGRNHTNRKKDATGPPDRGEEPESSSPDNDAAEKAQLAGQPLSELPTEYALSGFDPIKELPTQERPVELSGDPLPQHRNETSVLPYTPR
ncbi:hypothetical protein F5B19DRAFT_146421 [Rostrohypoxylon terebratum]|nr:hypothetical protein F5B19DRAFT_146421 [Rostrohypoxylon terebratum]